MMISPLLLVLLWKLRLSCSTKYGWSCFTQERAREQKGRASIESAPAGAFRPRQCSRSQYNQLLDVMQDEDLFYYRREGPVSVSTAAATHIDNEAHGARTRSMSVHKYAPTSPPPLPPPSNRGEELCTRSWVGRVPSYTLRGRELSTLPEVQTGASNAGLMPCCKIDCLTVISNAVCAALLERCCGAHVKVGVWPTANFFACNRMRGRQGLLYFAWKRAHLGLPVWLGVVGCGWKRPQQAYTRLGKPRIIANESIHTL